MRVSISRNPVRKYPPASAFERRLQVVLFLGGGVLLWGALVFAFGRGLGAW
jgi:hypothetical protein